MTRIIAIVLTVLLGIVLTLVLLAIITAIPAYITYLALAYFGYSINFWIVFCSWIVLCGLFTTRFQLTVDSEG